MTAVDVIAAEFAEQGARYPRSGASLVMEALKGSGYAVVKQGTVAPLGVSVTAAMVQEVWDTFVAPSQDDDAPQSAEMRCLMAILREAFAARSEVSP